MTFVTYDRRFRDTKLYALEALKVGIGAPLAKPRTALGAAHTAADNASHSVRQKCHLAPQRVVVAE